MEVPRLPLALLRAWLPYAERYEVIAELRTEFVTREVREGHPAAAARILEDAVRRFPDAPSHDDALYDLARALVLSANGGRDYRLASAHLDRLLREYPASSYAPDARALRIALNAYVARSAELDRLLERLKAIDLEFERPRQP